MLKDISIIGKGDRFEIIQGSPVVAQTVKVVVESWDDFNSLWEDEGFNPFNFMKVMEINDKLSDVLGIFKNLETEKGKIIDIELAEVSVTDRGAVIDVRVEYEGGIESISTGVER